MIATVTLFYNTGFNPKNIPDSQARLNGMTSQNFSSNYELQNSLITTCLIEATWGQVNNADYLKLDNTYFFIVNKRMLNENCCELSLQVDALTTLGGPANLNYTGGVIDRAHALNDDLFSNVIEEDISPKKPLVLVDDSITGSSAVHQTTLTLVGSTLSLTEPAIMNTVDGGITFTNPSDQRAFTFKGAIGTETYTITLPETPPIAPESIITMDGNSAKLSAVGLYSAGSVTANLRYLRMMNLDGAILYCYKIPTEWAGVRCCIISDDNGHTTEQGVQGKLNLTTSSIPIASAPSFTRGDYTARNNKVYAMYSTIRTMWELSGDEQLFDLHELYASGLTKPSFSVIMDPQPGGYFICHPASYQGSQTGSNYNFKAIHGAIWKTTPIAFDIPQGDLIQNANYQMARGKLQQQYWEEYGTAGGVNAMLNGAQITKNDPLMGAVIGGAGHVGKMIGEGFNGGRHLYNPLNELEFENYKRRIKAPDLTSKPAVGLTNVLSEKLHIQLIGPQVSDLMAFDRFFDYYGYAMGGEPFNKNYLSGRQYCNYIKCSDVHITSDSNDFGIEIKTEAERQLNNGVRIWHTKPQALTSNPIV